MRSTAAIGDASFTLQPIMTSSRTTTMMDEAAKTVATAATVQMTSMTRDAFFVKKRGNLHHSKLGLVLRIWE